MKYVLMVILIISFNAGCRHVPSGHDPNGPGNSENAPGHNKHEGGGPGNSENAPGQKKKQSY